MISSIDVFRNRRFTTNVGIDQPIGWAESQEKAQDHGKQDQIEGLTGQILLVIHLGGGMQIRIQIQRMHLSTSQEPLSWRMLLAAVAKHWCPTWPYVTILER